MNWNKLQSVSELESIIKISETEPVLLFKHSTRCSISSTALSRLERSWKDDNKFQPKPYYLDLIAFRETSNAIAAKFNVEHQSPQALLIYKGKCTYNASHLDISYLDITGETREILEKQA